MPPTDEVYLWLGASVMLAYPIDEAETLLESKFEAARQNLANCEEDLDFLREQITVRHPHPSFWCLKCSYLQSRCADATE